MKRLLRLFFILIAYLVAANVFAGGAVDKVTGEYTRGNCPGYTCEPPGEALGRVAHRMVSAHEASDKHPQKGFLLSWTDDGRWWEIDLSDTDNTCVHVFEDGRARIGGLVSDQGGNYSGRGPIGRYYGMVIEDRGEPAYWEDRTQTYAMTSIRMGEFGWEDVRDAFLDWCKDLEDFPFEHAIWPGIIFEGNLQVHNSPKDGD